MAEVEITEPDEETLLSFLDGAHNDCPCLLATSRDDMCQNNHCYHFTGNGACLRCAEGFGITAVGMIRIGYNAGLRAWKDSQ